MVRSVRSAGSDRDEDHIRVVVRSRPMNEQEKKTRQPCLVTVNQERKAVDVAQIIGGKKHAKTYHFDTVFIDGCESLIIRVFYRLSEWIRYATASFTVILSKFLSR